ncbi:vestitone reductase-like [Syzygium oleosum]|uniref:vestitone reductase-like n=1 Tax=Syzygium oleosum TaxID=219896 RepID=UPI0024BA1270|nr:vestitone reductase-like [Syzygium oleosum]
METDKGTVCVTGGTGYLALWMITRLLEQGYSVRATVRPDPDGKRDISFLTNLAKAPQSLQIFHADLGDPESFVPAIQGCVGVFHMAAAIDFHGREPEDVVAERAVRGAIGILKACSSSGTVRRVVYTSSSAAVHGNTTGAETMDEGFWTDVEMIRGLKTPEGPYMVSKTLAEKAVLDFGARMGLDVVVVVPSFMIGPFLCPKLPASIGIALAMVLGDTNPYKNVCLSKTSMVHPDDVVRAHIYLFEHPQAKGRFICSSDVITVEETAELLSLKLPELPLPSSSALKEIKGYPMPCLSSKKLLDIGFEFKHGLEDMFDGAIRSCKENGYL